MISKKNMEHKLRSDAYTAFVAETLNTSTCTTTVFVNRAFSGSLEKNPLALTRRMIAKGQERETKRDQVAVSDRSHHLFLPFFGGANGQAAAGLALQLAENPDITITMVHYQIRHEETTSSDAII